MLVELEYLLAISITVTLSIVVLLTYFYVFRYVRGMYNLKFNADYKFLKHLKIISICLGLVFCIGFPTYVVLANLDTRILLTLGLPIALALGLIIVCQSIILKVYEEHVRFHYVLSHGATKQIVLDFNEDIDKVWSSKVRVIIMRLILSLCILIVYLFNEPNIEISMKMYYFMVGLLVYFHQTLAVFSIKESKTLVSLVKSQIEKDK